MIDLDTKKGIEKIISNYDYGQYSLLNNNLVLKYDSRNRNIFIDDFYSHDILTNKDTCSGLMNKAYFDLRLTFKNLFVARVVGNDNEYFSRPKCSSHCFLLVSKSDIMNYCSVIDDPEIIDSIDDKNPLLVDPSFKKIVPLRDSGYSIRSLMNHDCKIDYSNSQTLKNKRDNTNFFPLTLSSDGTLLSLCADFDSKHLLGILVQKKGGLFELDKHYPLESDYLDKKFGNEPKVYQFIDHLRKAERIDVTNSAMLF